MAFIRDVDLIGQKSQESLPRIFAKYGFVLAFMVIGNRQLGLAIPTHDAALEADQDVAGLSAEESELRVR